MNPFELARKLIKGEAITDEERNELKKNYYFYRRIFSSRMFFAHVLNKTNFFTFTPDMIADFMKAVIPVVSYHYKLKNEQYLKNIFPKKIDREKKKDYYKFLTLLDLDYKTVEMMENYFDLKELHKEYEKYKKCMGQIK